MARSLDCLETEEQAKVRIQSPRWTHPIVHVALCISLTINFVFFASWIRPTKTFDFMSVSDLSCPASPFAGLARDVPKRWGHTHAGTSEEWAHIWDNATSYDAGVIALPDTYAREMGLPRAQRWPWDATKGIYILNAYHNLHCVKNIRSALEDCHAGGEPMADWSHIQHCLLVLRDEIFCNADDTPRYTGFQPQKSSGHNQVRMCRDWNKLEQWALQPEREGCWKHVHGEGGGENLRAVDRYRFCSKDSKYKEISETSRKADGI